VPAKEQPDAVWEPTAVVHRTLTYSRALASSLAVAQPYRLRVRAAQPALAIGFAVAVPGAVPQCVGGFADTVFGHQLTRHGRKHVIVLSNDCRPPSENLPSMARETSMFFAISRRQLDCIVPE